MDEQRICKCNIRKSGLFKDERDYINFSALLEASDIFKRIAQASTVALSETWYRCGTCKRIWRMVHPRDQSAGMWEVTNLDNF